MVVRYETPSIPGRRTRWMLRQQPQSNAEREARGYNAGRRLNPEEIATIAAAMGVPVAKFPKGGRL
jgi:hypothetical protein